MRAFLDRQLVPPEEIELDQDRWDLPRCRGNKNLYLELVEEDLVAIGRMVFHRYRGFLAEDPDYFKSPEMEDVVRPRDERVFADRPLRVKSFLRKDSFWRAVTIKAVMQHMNPWNARITAPRCRIEELTDVKQDGPHTILILGVRVPKAGGTGELITR